MKRYSEGMLDCLVEHCGAYEVMRMLAANRQEKRLDRSTEAEITSCEPILNELLCGCVLQMERDTERG